MHLPNQHSIIISNDPINIENLNQWSSMLLDYFKLNLNNEETKEYFYREIPQFFTHKKSKHDGINISNWESRKKHFNCIGRMYSVSPTTLELFHLRLLLLHVRGATSFESLKTVNGILQPSFTAACLALG